MARTVTTSEPRWTEQDRAEVLALALYREGLCPCGCGHAVADTTSPEDIGPQFVASRVACRARMALIEAQDALDSGQDKPSAAARSRLWSTQIRR